MEEATNITGPIIGFIVGLSLIFFRRSISSFIEKTYKSFPQNKDAIKTYNIKFELRPAFVAILGAIISLFSLIGFFKR
jgi:hypothetical protein